MRVILFTGTDAPTGRIVLVQELEKLGISSIVTFSDGDQAAAFLEHLTGSFSGEKKCLCIVTGYLFNEPHIAEIFARSIDNGMRLLVFTGEIDNKQLAERLNITNIKHKVRIERLELTDPDENDIRLISGILNDEIQRLGSRS